MDLVGKICVVTGASSGIGRRTAFELAADGAVVCAAARRRERLAALVAELGPEAGHTFVVTDVSQRADASALAAHVEARYGRCDVLINNAGLSDEGPFDGPDAIDRLERVMATNFLGAAYVTAELMALLLASAPSHVINVSSIAGRLPVGGGSGYGASKFALSGWSEALHLELAPRGVHVGVVEPGPVPTEGWPLTAMARDPVLRLALTTERAVARAIIDAVVNRKMERVVPRWYYLLRFPRLVCPPLYRWGYRWLTATRAARTTDAHRQTRK
jgi:uncharacterized protein